MKKKNYWKKNIENKKKILNKYFLSNLSFN